MKKLSKKKQALINYILDTKIYYLFECLTEARKTREEFRYLDEDPIAEIARVRDLDYEIKRAEQRLCDYIMQKLDFNNK